MLKWQHETKWWGKKRVAVGKLQPSSPCTWHMGPMEGSDYSVLLTPGIRLWVEAKIEWKTRSGRKRCLEKQQERGNQHLVVGRWLGKQEGHLDSLCLAASNCVILSSILLTCRMRDLDQGMAKSLGPVSQFRDFEGSEVMVILFTGVS